MIKILLGFNTNHLLIINLILSLINCLCLHKLTGILDDILTKYVRHNDNKFDYDNEGIAHRKHIQLGKHTH